MSASELKHYGTLTFSGRYPWGSGEDPYQRLNSFLASVHSMRKQGLSEVEIARGMGLTTSQLRARITISSSEIRMINQQTALKLKNKGWSNTAIGAHMGINESSVRSLLDPAMQERAKMSRATTDMLRESVKINGYIDVGLGSESYIGAGISRTKLKASLAELEEEGYKLHRFRVEQVGNPGKFTWVEALGGPESTYKEVVQNKDLVKPIGAVTEDYGRTFTVLGLKPIQSVDSGKVAIRYAEDGGADRDGLIELRRGAEGLDLGASNYAQVRIGVDGTHYLKGMAVYSDDLPDGVDIRFNTNKHAGTPKIGPKDNTVLKPMKDDPDNPFGSSLKRIVDDDGVSVLAQKGALNIVSEEGDWQSWSKTLSTQFLSKQTPALATKQLDLSAKLKQEEFDEIMSLTNPTIKKELLQKFADECDASASHLEAAGLPRQRWHSILPIPSLGDDEVYAPNYNEGERVAVIRFPHAGRFEIADLKVNNSNDEAKRIIGNGVDAVGITPKSAKKLSGADFDGDTVLIIPNNTGAIKSTGALKGLEDFDPIEAYPAKPGQPKPGSKGSGFDKGMQMGLASNLITDMTIKGAGPDELARAVRHSMVVIDAEKHNLDWKQSAIDNGISALKTKYQGGPRAGASTLISQAGSEKRIPERKEGALIGPVSPATGRPTRVYIDPNTGEKLYTNTGGMRVNKLGKTVPIQSKVSAMSLERDAYALSSGTVIESVYANHSNQLKKMANDARKASLSQKPIEYSRSANKVYQQEVESLRAKITLAEKNKPLERRAQILAGEIVAQKVKANPVLKNNYADLQKVRGQALNEARARIGAKKNLVSITQKEWDAIQSGAVANNTLKNILANSDVDKIKQYAMPRKQTSLSPARISRARSMMNRGYTQAEIASALGISVSTLNRALSQ